ncbi:MAG: hypothetical protein WD595_06830 [Waddliaceae bacterium]
MDEQDDDLEFYGDTNIASGNAKIPLWLYASYIIFPIWGIVWFFLYWNGATGWIDRGYWFELEQAANTTFPQEKGDEFKE